MNSYSEFLERKNLNFAFSSPNMLFPYMGLSEKSTEQVRCPVHGFIHYSQRERRIIDHPVFQRLRNVRQLALCCYLYPGAMHSRFEHSLGVMEMATRAFDALSLKYEDLLIEELKQVPELRTETIKRARQTVRMLALLHDVGHPAFSHAAESVLPAGKKHEEISIYVMESVLKKDLDELFFTGIADLLVRIMKKAPELIFLRQFVVGELDMDRTDYLWRDSLHCGVEYGKFDFRRLLESLAVLKHPDNGSLQIGLERGGEHTFEALILARYQMNTQVYYHRVRRIYDHYLTEYMKKWAAEKYKSFDDVLMYDDMKVLVEMSKDVEADNDRSDLAKRIIHRHHHKMIYQTGDSADTLQLRKAKKILARLQTDFGGVDFWLDDGAKGSIHKLTAPGQQDESRVEDFFIVEKNGKATLITEDSAVLEKIPREFRTVRIYADASGDQLRTIESAANRAAEGA